MSETESNWNGIYQIDGVITLILLAYSLITILIMASLGMPPGTTADVFAIPQANKFSGLLWLDVLTIFIMPLYYLLFVGLYMALKKTSGVPAAIAGLLGCAGLTLFLATPSVFSWLAHSDKFAAITSEAQKTLLLPSDMWHGTGALVGNLLMKTRMLLVSIVMLPWNVFGKATAWVGMVMHGLDLLHILVGFFLPSDGVALMMIAEPLYLLWFPLLARDFFRLGKE